jgi:hypothetical protein
MLEVQQIEYPTAEPEPEEELKCPHPVFLSKHWSQFSQMNETEAGRITGNRQQFGSPIKINTVFFGGIQNFYLDSQNRYYMSTKNTEMSHDKMSISSTFFYNKMSNQLMQFYKMSNK